jgi:hypothetical protein
MMLVLFGLSSLKLRQTGHERPASPTHPQLPLFDRRAVTVLVVGLRRIRAGDGALVRAFRQARVRVARFARSAAADRRASRVGA